jgi:two-component system LytT family response regulator
MKAIIVEDEKKNVVQLKRLLAKHCNQVQVIGEAANALDGAAMTLELKPDLVFLDIQMSKLSGFDMLALLGTYEFDVIFVTGHDQYGIQAVKCAALDYLLKPVKPIELIAAIAKAENKKRKETNAGRITNLLDLVRNPHKNEHNIALPLLNGYRYINPYEIMRLEAENNYTQFYLFGGEKVLISKGLYVYEEILEAYGFIRCHKSHLVNRKFIRSLRKGAVVYEVELSDGFRVPVSSRKISLITEALQNKT